MYFSTLMRVLSIFDREDLNAVYKLVMDKYQNEVPEGFDRVLWGDLMIMFNPNDEDEFLNTQQDWNIVSWKLHRSSGVHNLMTDTGLVIHMLVEKKIQKLRGNSRDWLDSYSFGNFAEIATGIKSLQEDGDIDFRPISNFKAMLREFLVLILLFSYYFISLMYNRDIVQIKWGDGSRINT
ncbi:hypothetical protein Tco_0822067 [Tanacetum coccineum]|uniref:Uncharacterized protein n=1 Tax=Tanacetum coccineum TaxID=301880 RepID=A0ABQ5AI92_9ASTR